VQHPAPAAPMATRATQRTFVAHARVADAEPEGIEVAANAGPVPVKRVTTAAIDAQRQTGELSTLKPIVPEAITIAPIQIQALN
jgi:hypothetical protein